MKSSLTFAWKFIKGLVLAWTMIEGAHAMHRRNEQESSPFANKTTSSWTEVVRTLIWDRIQFALTYARGPNANEVDLSIGGDAFVHLEK